MSWKKIWRSVEKAVSDVTDVVIDKPLHWLNEQGEKIFGTDNNDSWYAGYNSNEGPIFVEGDQANQIMGNGGMSGQIGSDMQHASGSGTINEIENLTNQGYIYGPHVTKSQSYKGNTAKTANSIKQGGMTKDDLITYNQKHPNETAGTNGSTKTSLNSNTATARY